jgi:COP9 signalosome complex subunit 2
MSSEEEYNYESGSGGEDYVYSEDGSDGNDSDKSSEIGSDVELENKFWEADGCKGDEPSEALKLFKEYLADEENRVKDPNKKRLEHEDVGSLRFHALQEVILLSNSFKQFEDMLTSYELLLDFLPNVTRNERSSAISNIISSLSSKSSSSNTNMQEGNHDIVMKIYEMTLKTLEESNIDSSLTFSTKKKLGVLYLEKKDYAKALSITKELHRMCQVNGEDDIGSKSEWLLEMYSLEIQICNAMNDSDRVKGIFAKTAALSNAIRDPRTMGILHESGGKMYMKEKNWTEAYNQFFNGFKNYQETGDPRAQTCLKYVVLANMLSSSDINPFDSREAKAYQDYPQVRAVIELRKAYEDGDAKLFERSLRNTDANLMEDEFLVPFIEPLMLEIRSKVLRKMVKPYKSVRLNFISRHLNVPDEEVEAIIMRLIMDGMLVGKIDQINGILHLGSVDKDEKYKSLETWTLKLKKLKNSFAAHPSQIAL